MYTDQRREVKCSEGKHFLETVFDVVEYHGDHESDAAINFNPPVNKICRTYVGHVCSYCGDTVWRNEADKQPIDK